MNKIKSILLLTLLIGLTAMFSGCHKKYPPEKIVVTGYGAQEAVEDEVIPEAVEKTKEVDRSWADTDVTAIGVGAPPATAINESQARNMARKAAKTDALRNLAETINGIKIDSATTVEDFVTKDDTIKSRVSGFIQGAQILEEKEMTDGSYEVKIGMNLKNLADIIQPEEKKELEKRPAAVTTGKPRLTPQQAKLMAKRAAETDARRVLLEQVKGTKISSSTYVQDYMAKSDSIRSQVDGLIQGAQIIATRYTDDGTCEVDMEFDLANVRRLVK